jgi:hypothetical protein
MRFSWSISCFAFSFSFFFACCNKWLDHIMLFGGRHTSFFIAKNTLVFTLIVQRVFSFSATAFSFCFSPWFLFRSCFIFISRCILTSGLCWFSSKELFQKRFEWCWKREKNSCKKVVQKGAYLDCGLNFCMSCLMSFW